MAPSKTAVYRCTCFCDCSKYYHRIPKDEGLFTLPAPARMIVHCRSHVELGGQRKIVSLNNPD